MYTVNSIPQQESDWDRAARMFVGFSNSIVGNTDQVYAGNDTSVYNATGQFTVANPDGTYSVAGVPRSNIQPLQVAGVGLMPLILIGGVIWYFVTRANK